jgi:hypothetical protein
MGRTPSNGPRQALRDALFLVAPEAASAKPNPVPVVAPDSTSAKADCVNTDDPVLASLNQCIRTGPRPLLIFDQLDDYIASHPELLRPRGNTIDAAALCAANPFWQALHQRLAREEITLLFINRTEYGSSQLPFQLHPNIGARDIPPVPAFKFESLLKSLGEKAIAHPEAGWEDFLGELLEQYEATKTFLPVRIRFTLDAVAANVLPYLHPRTLAAIGGIEGLEGALIRTRAEQLAVPLRLMPDKIVAFLDAFVICPVADQYKSAILTHEQLAEQFPGWPLDALLPRLVEVKLLRPRFDVAAGAAWSLYHDYLAIIVRRTHSAQREWEEAFKRRAEAWAKARTFPEKWRRLLSLRELGEFLLVNFRKAQLWAQHAGFLFWSTAVRVLLPLAVLGTIGWGLWLDAREKEDRVEGIRIAESLREVLSRDGGNAFVEIRDGPFRLKLAALRHAVENETVAGDWLKQREIVFLALAGFDPDGSVRRDLFDAIEKEHVGVDAWHPCWDLSFWLQARVLQTLPQPDTKRTEELTKRFEGRVADTRKLDDWDSFLEVARPLFASLSEKQRKAALKAYLDSTKEILTLNQYWPRRLKPLAPLLRESDTDEYRRIAELLSEDADQQCIPGIIALVQGGAPLPRALVDILAPFILADVHSVLERASSSETGGESASASGTGKFKDLAPWVRALNDQEVQKFNDGVLFFWFDKIGLFNAPRSEENTPGVTRDSETASLMAYLGNYAAGVQKGTIPQPEDFPDCLPLVRERLTPEQRIPILRFIATVIPPNRPEFFSKPAYVRLVSAFAAELPAQVIEDAVATAIRKFRDWRAPADANATWDKSYTAAWQLLSALAPRLTAEQVRDLWERGKTNLGAASADGEARPTIFPSAATIFSRLPAGDERTEYLALVKGEPQNLAPERKSQRERFVYAASVEEARSALADWKAIGGPRTEDAALLAAWLKDPETWWVKDPEHPDHEDYFGDALLVELSRIYGRKFGHLWAFTAWAAKAQPALLDARALREDWTD